MISSSDFSSRVEKLIKSGVDERIAPIKAVLDYGLEKGNITADEAAAALSTLSSFLASHPGFVFRSPRERYEKGTEQSSDEAEMWSTIQPVLDKAQNL